MHVVELLKGCLASGRVDGAWSAVEALPAARSQLIKKSEDPDCTSVQNICVHVLLAARVCQPATEPASASNAAG